MNAILHPLLMGGGWLTALIWMAVLGNRDKIKPMPIIGMFFNAAWQGTVLLLPTIDIFTKAVVMSWFGGSIILIYLHFKQLNERQAFESDNTLLAKYFGLIAGTAVLVLVANMNPILPDNDSGGFAAHAINLIISVQFCWMIIKRGNLKGQSIGIGIAKLLGTAATYMFNFEKYLASNEPYTIFCAMAILAADIVYIALIITTARRDKVNVFNPVYKKEPLLVR